MMLILIILSLIAFIAFAGSHIRENITNKKEPEPKKTITVDMIEKEFNDSLEFERKTDELIRKWKTSDQI